MRRKTRGKIGRKMRKKGEEGEKIMCSFHQGEDARVSNSYNRQASSNLSLSYSPWLEIQ